MTEHHIWQLARLLQKLQIKAAPLWRSNELETELLIKDTNYL